MANRPDTVEKMGPTTEEPEIDLKASLVHDHADVALNFLEGHERITYTQEEEKTVIHKIDRVLMPLVSVRIRYPNVLRLTCL